MVCFLLHMGNFQNKLFYQISDRRFDIAKRIIVGGDINEKLSFKSLAVLLRLIETPKALVSRDELIRTIWDDNFLVGDKGLTQAVWHLRKALENEEDDPPKIIETVPKKGYRLLVQPGVIFLDEKETQLPTTYLDADLSQLFCDDKVLSLPEEYTVLLSMLADNPHTTIPLSLLAQNLKCTPEQIQQQLIDCHHYLQQHGWAQSLFLQILENQLTLATKLEFGVGTTTSVNEFSGDCPFRGLEVFREEDKDFFFGREALSLHISEYLTGKGFMAVLGPSGSGKSSLVQAGVIPQLRVQGQLIALFTPSQQPLTELAFTLQTLFEQSGKPQPAEQILARLRDSTDALSFITRELIQATKSKGLCLVIDQFEELFTLTKFDEREAFVNTLCQAFQQPAGLVKIIFTMRSDFIGQCVVYPKLNQLITGHLIQIAPMDNQALTQAIEAPAQLAGLTLEVGLLQRILDDVTGASSELPLLEHALLELFERRRGSLLTLSAYVEIGGIEGALAKRAEAEYQNLDGEEKQTLRKLFVLGLIHPGEGAEDTRRRATKEELLAIGSDSVITETLLNHWTQARLFTAYRDEGRDTDMVDVAHELLIRKWPRIFDWMSEDRENARLINRLRRLAQAWDQAGRDGDHLLRGAPLQQMTALCEQERVHLTPLEIDFVTAGRDRHQQVHLEKEARQQQELANAHKQTVRTRIVAGAFVMLVSIFGTISYLQKTQTELQAQATELKANEVVEKTLETNFALANNYNEKAITSLENNNSIEAWLYTLAALSLDIPQDKNTVEFMGRFANPKMRDANQLLWKSPLNIENVALQFNPKNKVIALVGKDHKIRLIDSEQGTPISILSGHSGPIKRIVFSKDGNILASTSSDKSIRLWKFNFEQTQPFYNAKMILTDQKDISRLAFSDDNELLVASSKLDDVKIYKVSNGKVLHSFQIKNTDINTTLFLSDNKSIVTGDSNGIIRIHNIISPEKIIEFDTGYGEISDLILDNKNLISAHKNGEVVSWNMHDSSSIKEEHKVNNNGNQVVILETFQGGGQFASMDEKQNISIWNIDTLDAKKINLSNAFKSMNGTSISNIISLDNPRSLSINHDGSTLAFMKNSFELNLIDIETGKKTSPLLGHKGPVRAVDISPDGQSIVSAGNKTVKIWDLNSGQLITSIQAHNKIIWDVAYSPNGNTIASASADNLIKIWDANTGRLKQTFDAHKDITFGIAFSPDGKTLVSSSKNKAIVLWDVETGSIINILKGHNKRVWEVTFSPDGEFLASASFDHSVILWKVNSGVPVRKFLGHTDAVWSVDFSPNGKKLASSSSDGTVKTWDSLTGIELNSFNYNSRVYDVKFSPDGKYLAAALSEDNSIKIWEPHSGLNTSTIVGQRFGDVLFTKNGKRLISASGDGLVSVWQINLDHSQLKNITSEKRIDTVSFSNENQIVALAYSNLEIELWDYKKNKLIHLLEGHTGSIESLSFNTDGKYLASASRDTTIKVWDIKSGDLEFNLKGHSDFVHHIAISRNGNTMVSIGQNYEIIVWSLDEGKILRRFNYIKLPGISDVPRALAISNDAKELACGMSDGSIVIYSLTTGKQLKILKGHLNAITFLEYSNQGHELISFAWNNAIKLWDMTTYKNTYTDFGKTAQERITYSSESHSIAIYFVDKSIEIWDIKNDIRTKLHINSEEELSSLHLLDYNKTIASTSFDAIKFFDIDFLNSIVHKGFNREDWEKLFHRSLMHFGYSFSSGKLNQEDILWFVPQNNKKPKLSNNKVKTLRKTDTSLINRLIIDNHKR